MADEQQFDYAKLPDGSYAKFPKGTSPEVMRQKLTTAGLLKAQPQKAQAAPSAAAPAASAAAPQKSLGERTIDVLGQGIESTMDLPKRLMARGRELYGQADTLGGRYMAPLRAEREEITNALKGLWSSTAPGMIGQPPENKIANALMMFAGQAEGGEPVRGLEEAATKPIRTAADKGIQTPTRITLQRFGGAGKEPVLLENIRRKAQVENAQANYQKATEEYRNATEQSKAAYADKVKKARADWVQKSMEAKQGQAESARVDAQRQSLERGHETYAEKLRLNLQQTYATVKGRLDARWNHLRETPINVPGGAGMKLRDMPLDSKAIADTVDIAEKKYLQGSPESIKQFRDLMNWMQQGGGQVGTEGGAGTTPQLRPITWDEARTHFSNLGDRMFSGDLPGNITNAIRFVREAGLGEQLRAGAERAGAGPQYSSLLKDWSGFEHDWRDMSSVTTKGGSPLARARMAPNAATLAPQITGRTGDLVLQRLGKYKDAGASIPLAEGVRKIHGQIEDLPTIRVPKAPGKLELPAEPKPKAPPELEAVKPIDPEAIRRKKLIEYSARPMSLWDFLGPRLIERPLMSNEAIRNWVARQPRKEIEP